MEYNFKINVETEEVDVYVKDKDFENNDDVKEFYATEFGEKYNISQKSVWDILDDYGIWFEDEDIVNFILKEYVDELKEIFEEEVEYALEDYDYCHNGN